MSKFLLIALLIASPAFADVYSVSDNSGNLVRLFEEPCDAAPAWMGMRKAFFRYQGKEYQACWFAMKTVVIVLDANGDATPIPMAVFKKEEAT